METGITITTPSTRLARPDVSGIMGYKTMAERAMGNIERIMSATESHGKTWFLRGLEARDKLERNLSLKSSFNLLLSIVVAVSANYGRLVVIKNNADSSIKLGGVRIERTTDMGASLFRQALRTLNVSGQADPKDQQFISNLKYSPDQIENEILIIRKRYPTSEGEPMVDPEEMLDLARRGTNDSLSLSAVSSAKRIEALLNAIEGRTEGQGNIKSLSEQIRINGRVSDPDTYYKVDKDGKIVRKDGKSMPNTEWLVNLDK